MSNLIIYLYLKNLAVKVILGVTTFKNSTYSYSCLAVQDVINKQLCSVYHLYLASFKKM